MSAIESGNWYDSPWRFIRKGIEQVTFGMEADLITCTIGRVENNAEVNPHSHPNEQIALVIEGKCDYYVDGVPYKLTKGSWVVVPPNVVHYIHVYESDVPCLQMDIFSPARPEYVKQYKDFLAEQG
jgi:mannose-6-phosphate isomerase-like protein (cupin superfamily)